jgi:protein MpaA
MDRCRTLWGRSRYCTLSIVFCCLLGKGSGESGERRWDRLARRNAISALPCPLEPDASRQCAVVPLKTDLPTPAVVAPVPVLEQPVTIKAVESRPEIVQLGYSVKGIPIVMQIFGQEGPVTLIFGAIHGSEPNSGELARRLLDFLSEHPAAYAGHRVAIIPVANPDGLARNQRLNENKIDLNRNFPAANWAPSKAGMYHGGEKAASEPETQAIIKAVELLNPQRIVSIHAITRGRECNNYDGPAVTLAELMKAKNGYRVAKTIGYPTPGSFGSWAGLDRQIATITLELPHDLSGEESWRIHAEALQAVIRAK